MSTDEGQTWKVIDLLTGQESWSRRAYDLSEVLTEAKTLLVRFHLQADSTVNKDGWLVDNVKILGPDGDL